MAERDSDPLSDGDPPRPEEDAGSEHRSRSGRHSSRRSSSGRSSRDGRSRHGNSSRRHSSRHRRHREGSGEERPPSERRPSSDDIARLTGDYPRLADGTMAPPPEAPGEAPAEKSANGDEDPQGERKRRRRRSRRRAQEREFRPYTRPKSRHHESQIDNALKKFGFSLRANWSWFRRRLKRGFRSRKRRTAADFIKPRRRTNFRIIAITAAVAGLAFVLVPQWRERQLRLATASMLERAKALQAEQKYREAALAANEFVKLRPDSVEGNAVLAQCYGREAVTSAEKTQAAEFYTKALQLDSENVDLRREFAKMLFEGDSEGHYQRAEGQAEKILDVDNNDAAAWRILGLSLYAQSRSAEGPSVPRVIESLKSAVSHNPENAELAAVLARLYRSEMSELYAGERQSLADEVMDYLVQSAPQSPDALLARYAYRLRYFVPGADADLDQALNLAPDNDRVLVAAGERSLRRGRWLDARGPFLRLLSLSSVDPRGFLGLGLCHLGLGEASEAVDMLERGLREAGERDVALNLQLAQALIDAGNILRATEVLTSAEALIGNVPALDEKMNNRPQYEEAQLRRSAWLFAGAKLAFAQLEYAEAVRLLKDTQLCLAAISPDSELVTTPLSPAPTAAQVTQLLADCYSAQGQPEQAAAAYNELRTQDPKDPSPLLASARAWLTAGRIDRALLALDEAERLSDTPESWMRAVKVHLEIQAALPEGERNWKSFESALAQVKRSGPDTPQLLLAQAESRRLQGQDAPALALIVNAQTLAPASTEALEALLTLHLAAGRHAEAAAALDAFEKQHGRSDLTMSARVEITAAQGDLGAAVTQLRELRTATPAARRLPRSLQLVRLQLEAGQVDGARRLLRELVEESPHNKRLIVLGAALALQARDAADVPDWQAKLEALEGPDGLEVSLLRARRILLESPPGPAPAEAETLYVSLRDRDADAQSLCVLQGLLAERRGDPQQAIDAFQRALRLGDQEHVAYRQLYVLLARDGRALDLVELVRRLERAQGQSRQLRTSVGGAADIAGVLLSTSLPSAADDVRRFPDDTLRAAWLAQLLAQLGRTEDARRTISGAWKESQGSVEVATAALAMAATQKDETLLASIARRIEQNNDLPPRRRAFLLGQAEQLAGDMPAAEKYYREALTVAAEDPGVVSAVAKFFIGRDRAMVQTILTSLLGATAQPTDPRRALGRLLADHGQAPQWLAAWEETFHPSANDAPSTDVYSTVVQCVRRGGTAELDRAAELLAERTNRTEDPAPDDRYLLASLYESRGRLKDAREQFVRLLGDHNDKPVYVAAYLEMLLRYNNLEEAAGWVATLHELAPNDPEAVALEARLLGLQGKTEQVEPLVAAQTQRMLDQSADEAGRRHALAFAAETYVSVGNPTAAERELRKLADLSRNDYLPLCQFLVAQGRSTEALNYFSQTVDQSPQASDVVSLSKLVCDGRVLPADFARAAPLLNRTLQDFSNDVAALTAAAQAARYHADDVLAVKLLRAALAAQPDRYITLANLAVVLSGDKSGADEAEELIQRAHQLSLGASAVWDAQGQVLLKLGRVSEAVEVLHHATDRAAATPLAMLHLAAAEFRQENLTAARTALVRAKSLGLNRNGLLPDDRQSLNELERTLNAN